MTIGKYFLPTMNIFVVVLALCLVTWASAADIYDPAYIFCGALNCYDILAVERTAELREIKKAYRRLSLTHHPDKNKEADATEKFRVISKAYEVLGGNESRSLFDYYLDHPRDYFKVSGKHYFRALPKSDVWVVLGVVVFLLSWLFRHIQYSKYQQAVDYLVTASVRKLSLQEGGSKQTLDLHKRAVAIYEVRIREEREQGINKDKLRPKMQEDPLFIKCVSELVAEVKIEGGHRKPEWNELFAFQLVSFPYTVYLWWCKYHRRYISSVPLSLEERTEMARETVGFGSWEELTEVQREDLINKEIWKPEVQDRLRREARRAEMGEDDVDYDEGEGEEDEGPVPVEGSKQLKKAAIKVEQQQKKQLKKLKKK